MPVAAAWALEVRTRDGRMLLRHDGLTKREVERDHHRAVNGDLPVEENPWEVVVVTLWEGQGCPGGHRHDKEPSDFSRKWLGTYYAAQRAEPRETSTTDLRTLKADTDWQGAERRMRLERFRKCVADGLSGWQIAERLGMTEEQVRDMAKNHGIRLRPEVDDG